MPTKPKVAVLVRRFVSTGGAEKYAVEVTKRLTERFDVTVFCEEFEDSWSKNLKLVHVPCLIKRPRFMGYWNFSENTRRMTKDYDIIHSHERVTHGDVTTLHCPCFRSYRLNKTSTCKSWRERINEFLMPRYIVYGYMEKKQFLGNPNRKFIVPSRYVEKNAQQLYDLEDRQFVLAPPGVESFSAHSRDGSLRKKLGINPDEFLFLFVGTEFKRKGLDNVFKALLQLPLCKLLVAGGGPIEQYQKKANLLGIEKQVIFLGMWKDMDLAYQSADAFVLPTLIEPFGMAPLEAMAAKLPVIMSNEIYCGFAMELESHEAILLDDPTDTNTLATKMEMLMNTDAAQLISQAGYEKSKKFTWDRAAEITMNTYDEILKHKK